MLIQTVLTDLTVPIALISSSVTLAQLLVELPDHVVFGVHDVEVFILVPFALLVFVLAAAADVVEDLPELVVLD